MARDIQCLDDSNSPREEGGEGPGETGDGDDANHPPEEWETEHYFVHGDASVLGASVRSERNDHKKDKAQHRPPPGPSEVSGTDHDTGIKGQLLSQGEEEVRDLGKDDCDEHRDHEDGKAKQDRGVDKNGGEFAGESYLLFQIIGHADEDRPQCSTGFARSHHADVERVKLLSARDGIGEGRAFVYPISNLGEDALERRMLDLLHQGAQALNQGYARGREGGQLSGRHGQVERGEARGQFEAKTRRRGVLLGFRRIFGFLDLGQEDAVDPHSGSCGAHVLSADGSLDGFSTIRDSFVGINRHNPPSTPLTHGFRVLRLTSSANCANPHSDAVRLHPVSHGPQESY